MAVGDNTMKFNQNAVKKMLQHYFDCVLFAEDAGPKVESVRWADYQLEVAVSWPMPEEKT